jgi:CBS domain-containing protein
MGRAQPVPFIRFQPIHFQQCQEAAMTIQARYQTLREIKSTNGMQFEADMDVVEAADTLLKAHKTGAPVVDNRGVCVGMINETILLDALLDGKTLKGLAAREVMDRPHPVKDDTTIDAAIRFMDERHLQQVPVVRDGKLVGTVTRHDLLRALLDLGMGVEQ